MKKIAFILVLVLPVLANAQTTSYGSFKVDAQEIIYQKVFSMDSVTAAKLGEYYIALPFVANLQAGADEVTFDMNEVVVDYKKFQFAQVAVPPVIQTGKYTGKVSIGVKEGKYRVTVRNIVFTGDTGYKKVTEKDKLTNYACTNNGTVLSRDWCKPNTLGLLDKAFTDKLEVILQAKKKDKDDW